MKGGDSPTVASQHAGSQPFVMSKYADTPLLSTSKHVDCRNKRHSQQEVSVSFFPFLREALNGELQLSVFDQTKLLDFSLELKS